MKFCRATGGLVGRTLADLFVEIASSAIAFDEPFLAHLCRMAAMEARNTVVPRQEVSKPGPIGIFDWDIANDVNRLDPTGAKFFGVNPAKAARGLANSNYLHAIHSDDVQIVGAFLADCIKGGVSEAEYRVVTNDQPRWIFAKGSCTLDRSNRPARFGGIMMVIGKKLS
jgi:PAS domain-containing protein